MVDKNDVVGQNDMVGQNDVVGHINVVGQNDMVVHDNVEHRKGQPQGIAPTIKTIGDIVGTFKPKIIKYPAPKIMKITRDILLLFFLIPYSAYGQQTKNRFETKFGYGYYQGFNIGLNYFYAKNLKVGFGLGSHLTLPPFENEQHFNIQLENTLFFGKRNIQSVGGWYFNQQLMYWEQGESNDRWKIMSLGLNIGKTISITKRIGLDLEFGPAYNLVLSIKKDPSVETSGWMWPILYNGRVQLTYKF